jgi:hypothetical protein
VDQIPESVACIAKNPLVTRETTPSRHPWLQQKPRKL